ncbi:unnamed protein product [Protopolystoma xenopodis]|uniref:Uncharacterized protein n=1 Tax=Protopolystoma xenopodis TaxID=117903 RepID=A0A448WC99_9PLAT|nr:unnamed protein product [Protopolystoma xenopodis]
MEALSKSSSCNRLQLRATVPLSAAPQRGVPPVVTVTLWNRLLAKFSSKNKVLVSHFLTEGARLPAQTMNSPSTN